MAFSLFSFFVFVCVVFVVVVGVVVVIVVVVVICRGPAEAGASLTNGRTLKSPFSENRNSQRLAQAGERERGNYVNGIIFERTFKRK